jgi:diguanylate cyclase (GGDEF)-like protein
MTTDVLDGRRLARQLDDGVARAREADLDVSIAFGDIDGLKRVNAFYGHAWGDVVISGVLAFVAGAAPPEYLVARYEGDQILVVLFGADLAAAREWADDIRADLEEFHPPPLQGPVTVSWGVATDDGTEDPQAVFVRADEAMRRAKRLGKNRVETAGGGES